MHTYRAESKVKGILRATKQHTLSLSMLATIYKALYKFVSGYLPFIKICSNKLTNALIAPSPTLLYDSKPGHLL
ncbi:hypothetical protein BCV72DRAFT_223195 [Rhizopus microsporus var. microsporus]|uniref:Uncharacterized protein n=2 Tax=Rhizopus microsporus TaxID=58291 RepID=A0A2G4SEL8_RHIZD|nr:uncharacterized protein RHIMIDRAFT_277366 [Rhizopus microsporus ATCC 52813]XP_023463104.1 uncharacterized protein RHIMIDRAFT_263762 [Rhizopus microsporus ATCC 52813]ORE09552.1 hypothetical protein BCV72DRAFT_223195 [Rhizopus microsporus var. microsporus]PHZ07234.1 hypothetical protein RHIMIDRAFT_277366 [Rhizopus microsporus ATCC 52813]PHZ09396.1 hypothetical protein RHIMIDRAFT_263762 [Rhizopus microsporus ATCC 52813]